MAGESRAKKVNIDRRALVTSPQSFNDLFDELVCFVRQEYGKYMHYSTGGGASAGIPRMDKAFLGAGYLGLVRPEILLDRVSLFQTANSRGDRRISRPANAVEGDDTGSNFSTLMCTAADKESLVNSMPLLTKWGENGLCWQRVSAETHETRKGHFKSALGWGHLPLVQLFHNEAACSLAVWPSTRWSLLRSAVADPNICEV